MKKLNYYITPARQILSEQDARYELGKVIDRGHFAEGQAVHEFENSMKKFIGRRFALATNSGSSANLLAMLAVRDLLRIGGDKRNSVLVLGAGFPTTLNPVIQAGMYPVFIDTTIGAYVPSGRQIRDAIMDNKDVCAIFMAHTLGNPLPVEDIKKIGQEFDVVFLEDNCDALGSLYDFKKTGGFGLVATQSFYPAHHISTGEGGMVLTDSPKLERILRSYRDWGRDCWCPPGEDNTCGKRFEQQFGELPHGYDHKYVYSRIGYNLKMGDLQGALGISQMKIARVLIEKRRQNFIKIYRGLLDAGLDEFFVLPYTHIKANPSWFGFPLTVRKSADFTRNHITRYLEEWNIGTRNLFGGNLLRQPAYQDWNNVKLPNSDRIMTDTFWFGCHPEMGDIEIEYVVDVLKNFTRTEHENL